MPRKSIFVRLFCRRSLRCLDGAAAERSAGSSGTPQHRSPRLTRSDRTVALDRFRRERERRVAAVRLHKTSLIASLLSVKISVVEMVQEAGIKPASAPWQGASLSL